MLLYVFMCVTVLPCCVTVHKTTLTMMYRGRTHLRACQRHLHPASPPFLLLEFFSDHTANANIQFN